MYQFKDIICKKISDLSNMHKEAIFKIQDYSIFPTEQKAYDLFNWFSKLHEEYPGWFKDISIIQSIKNDRMNYIFQLCIVLDLYSLTNYSREKISPTYSDSFFKTIKRALKLTIFSSINIVKPTEKRNIVIFFSKNGIGGCERALTDLLNIFTANNWTIDLVYTSNKSKSIIQSDINDLVRILSLSEVSVNTYDLAINYAHWITPQYMFHLCKAKKYIQFIHNDLLNSFSYFPKVKFFKYFKKIDYFICVSFGLQRNLLLLFPEIKQKTKVFYNAYDFNFIDTQLNHKELPISIEPNQHKLLTVARLVEAKGLRKAIRVANMLKRANFSFVWYIIGEGPLYNQLLQMIKDNNLEKNVLLLGLQKNPFPLMKAVDLLIMPSYYEGYGLVALEAKYIGIPVILNDFCSAEEIIDIDGEGLISNSSDISLFECIISNKWKRKSANIDTRRYIKERYLSKTNIGEFLSDILSTC